MSEDDRWGWQEWENLIYGFGVTVWASGSRKISRAFGPKKPKRVEFYRAVTKLILRLQL